MHDGKQLRKQLRRESLNHLCRMYSKCSPLEAGGVLTEEEVITVLTTCTWLMHNNNTNKKGTLCSLKYSLARV